MKKILLPVLLGCLPFLAPTPVRLSAQTTSETKSSSGTVHLLAESFFDALEKNKIDEGMNQLLAGSRLLDTPDSVEKFKERIKETLEKYGEVIGYELIEQNSVGSNLKQLTYLSLGRKYPLRWRIYFYKVDYTWRVIDLQLDDKIPALFDREATP